MMANAGFPSTRIQRKMQFYVSRIGALPRSTRHLFEEQRQLDFSNAVLMYGYKCNECGIVNPFITTDHIIPKSKGGKHHDPSNLQPLCRSCHRLKDNIKGIENG